MPFVDMHFFILVDFILYICPIQGIYSILGMTSCLILVEMDIVYQNVCIQEYISIQI